MSRLITYISIFLTLSSCLKKVDEVDHLNTNIFDPEYEGEQWWVYEEVVKYTNSNNDVKVKMDFSVPEEGFPTLKPPGFSVYVLVNSETDTIYNEMLLNNFGYYKSSVTIDYSGNSDYCVELGMYDSVSVVTYNGYEECKSL